MRHRGLEYFIKNLSVAIGSILIWRGIWVALDLLDGWLFGGSHIITAIGGVVFGILILYLPDHNLKALERL